MSRVDAIRQLLQESPDDTFLLYSLGMELLAAGKAAEAAGQFRRVLELDSQYLAAYRQAAQALRQMGDIASAAQMLRRGLAVADQAGDTHARDQLRLLLDALEQTS